MKQAHFGLDMVPATRDVYSSFFGDPWPSETRNLDRKPELKTARQTKVKAGCVFV